MPEYWPLYNSHANDQGGGTNSSDSPDLKLGRIESLRWFAGRHLKRFVLLSGLIVGCAVGMVYFTSKAPVFLSTLMQSAISVNGKKVDLKKDNESPAPLIVSGGAVGDPENPGIEHSDGVLNTLMIANTSLTERLKVLESEKSDLEKKVTALEAENVIAAVFSFGVVLANGKRVEAGESFLLCGEKEVLAGVDESLGQVVLESGRVLHVR